MSKPCVGLLRRVHPHSYWNPAVTGNLRDNYLSPNHHFTSMMLPSRSSRPATHPGKGEEDSQVQRYCAMKLLLQFEDCCLLSLHLFVVVIPPSVMSQWDANRLPNKPFGEHKDVTCFVIPKENIKCSVKDFTEFHLTLVCWHWDPMNNNCTQSCASAFCILHSTPARAATGAWMWGTLRMPMRSRTRATPARNSSNFWLKTSTWLLEPDILKDTKSSPSLNSETTLSSGYYYFFINYACPKWHEV